MKNNVSRLLALIVALLVLCAPIGAMAEQTSGISEIGATVALSNFALSMGEDANFNIDVTAQLDLAADLQNIQRDLFLLAADFASDAQNKFRIGSEQTAHLEELTHKLEEQLPPQRCFLIPGGCLAAAQLHVARTVCRRAERQAVALQAAEPIGTDGLVYLNRLSDYLYLAARMANRQNGAEDVKA